MIHVSVFENWQMWPFNDQWEGSKIGCMGTAWFKPKPQNQRLTMCACLLVRYRLAREQLRPFLSCIVTGDDKWCIYANIRKWNEWVSLNKNQLPNLHASTKDNVMLLVEHGGCAALRIASSSLLTFIANNWDVLLAQSKKNDQYGCVKWCHSTIMPTCTLLTWQKGLYRRWVGKSFCTHPINLILHPQIFTFSVLCRTTFKELPFWMKMCSEHGLTTSSTQNHAISTDVESKN